jgi:hypothetical protein
MDSIYISGLVDITVKKGRWSAYEVKTEKFYPHVPSIMRGIIEARLGDTVEMNRKVILERDDPRRLSATIILIFAHQNSKGTTNKFLFHLRN